MALHPVIERVTARIAERSRPDRDAYLALIDAAAQRAPARRRLSCGNLAHAFAASGDDKLDRTVDSLFTRWTAECDADGQLDF
ncbi:MAG: hypothetical protein ACK4ST_17065, partial [Elioraea tepidiphila]